MKRLRSVVLAGAVALGALLPLYGSTTPGTAVTHPEWAHMILRGLDLLEGGGAAVTDSAAPAFAALSGRDSRSWPADRYLRASNVERVGPQDAQRIQAVDVVGEAIYGLAVTRSGDYRLRLRLASPTPVEAELVSMGSDELVRSFVVPAGEVMGWVDAGVAHLDPGAYDASVLLPEGATLEHVELAPPCLRPIEPRGGWRPTAVTTTEDAAVTVLQALDMEHELPPAAPPLEYHGTDLVLEDGSRAIDVSVGEGVSGSFRGGPRGARVMLLADIPEAGLYTVSVFGVPGNGQRWLADGCRMQIVCPSADPSARWRVVLSDELGEGRHFFAIALGPDSVIERIRIEQRKDDPADYVATTSRLGLDLGAPGGDITRDQAEEARRFLQQRRAAIAVELCGAILEPGTLMAELATGAGPGAGSGTGGTGGSDGGDGGGGAGGGDPVPPPVIPPLPPASGTLPVGFGG